MQCLRRANTSRRTTWCELNFSQQTLSNFFSSSIAPYSKINKSAYFTISQEGVTFWSPTENHFTRLDEWYREYLKFCELYKLKIFRKFRVWKTFMVWLKSIKFKKINEARKFLEENLFFANPKLNATLLKIRSEFCELEQLKFTDITLLENWHLFYFIESQMAKFEETRDALYEFRKKMIDQLFQACYEAMLDRNYSPEDEIINCKSVKKLKEQISFTMRAAKRNFCSRLTNFLCLADFIIINLLHSVLRNSFAEMAQIFQSHTDCGPSFEKLRELTDVGAELEDVRPSDAPQSPLLTTELVLKPDSVEVDPSRNVTLYIVGQMIGLFLEAIHNVRPFQSDEKFKLFTEPSIVGHQENRLYDCPPSVDFMIEIDEEMKRNRRSIVEDINTAYAKCEEYVKRFEPIREAYKEDVQMDKEKLRKEKDLDSLITYCERFTNEMNGLEGLLPVCNLGLMQLRQGTFKEEIIPTCRELLSILEELLPNLAKETVLEVREKAENLMTKLTTVPIDAQSFVNYLDFLEKCSVRIEDIEKVLGYALRAFQIMKEFEIMISDEEKENFLDTEDFLLQLKAELESKVTARQEIIDQLAESLQNDIKNIFEEVEVVRTEIMKPELIDVSIERFGR
jgi:dynein heavy chain, axonemal